MSLFVVNSSVSPPPTGTTSASSAMLDAVIPSAMSRVLVSPQSSQQLNLRLPSGQQVALDATRMPAPSTGQQFRAASLPDSNQTAALFSANQHTQSVAISDTQLNRLTDQLARLYTSASDAKVSIKAQVTAVRPEGVSLQLSNGQNLTVPVRLASAHTGEQVTLDLTRQDGKALLSLKGTAGQSTLSTTLANPDKALIRDVVSGALRNNGITLDARGLKSLPDALSALVPKTSGQMLQHQVTVSERAGNLTVQSASLQAVGRFSLPAGAQADTLAQLDSKLIDKSAVNRLPMLNASGVAASGSAQGPVQAAGLSAQQRNDVHQQIITLSRQLLSETGSTRTALNQLVSALEMPAKGAAPATQALLTALQTRVRGLEQGATFSSFTSQAKADGAQAGLTAQANAADMQAKPGNLLGTMAQRVKDMAALLSQTATAQEVGEVATQSKSAGTTPATPQTAQDQVKALLNAVPLPLSQAVLARPAGGNDLVGALVTMLQFSLAGRAINRQPSLARQADRSDSLLSKSMAASSKGLSGSPSRVAQDMSQIDSRSSLVQSLKTVLSNHQQATLTNADNRLQGQDSLYYLLPTTGSEVSPPELLIRRDQSGNQQDNDQQATPRNWHLTMKLDVGEVGELLAKSRISGETIELDLYASSEPLLRMVADTLPFFTRRIEANGLEVTRTSFQRGKVPGTLREQPHHIFETMV